MNLSIELIDLLLEHVTRPIQNLASKEITLHIFRRLSGHLGLHQLRSRMTNDRADDLGLFLL